MVDLPEDELVVKLLLELGADRDPRGWWRGYGTAATGPEIS